MKWHMAVIPMNTAADAIKTLTNFKIKIAKIFHK